MLYQKIEKYFDSDKQLAVLEREYQSVLEKIDNYSDLFVTLTDSASLSSALCELTGLYMSISTVVAIATEILDNKEAKAYVDAVSRKQYSGEKVLDSVLKKEAKLEIQMYSRVKNLFASYLDKCDRAIYVCQSLLKPLERERNFTKYQ